MRTTLPSQLALGLAICLILTCVPLAQSQEDKPAVDRYALPQTDKPEELLKFIEGLDSYRPSPREAKDYRKKADRAIFLAADRIMEVAKDQSSPAFRAALALTLPKKLKALYLRTEQEQAEQYAEWKKLYEKATWGEIDLTSAASIAQAFEGAGNLKLAGQAYSDFAAMLAKKSGDAAEYRTYFEGCARRMRLPGQVLDLQGTLVNGKKFDLKSLRGKVVLIDFFATWCGPCLEELPNIRRAYTTYKDRGFDVVSISIDEDRDALEGFLARYKLPWTVIHEKESGGTHPAEAQFGIQSYPTMFLVDREGKVVSLDAQGSELNSLLKMLMPEGDKAVTGGR